MHSHLRFDKHGHVHEHVVQLLDALLQLHDVVVSRLDVLQRLARLRRVGQDLKKRSCEQRTENRAALTLT